MVAPHDEPASAAEDRRARAGAPAIRDELRAAQQTILERWARPGSFWTGEGRLAIVEHVRRARDADSLPPWAEPSSIGALLSGHEILPGAAIDAVWRLTNHPGTLTIGWYERLLRRGLLPGAYVELVAVVAQANCIDRFTDALGLARHPLPEPVAGRPVAELAPDSAVRTHWVPTAPVRGANVLRALSLLPFEHESRRILSEAHYVSEAALLGDLRSARGALSRPQIELIAARTSTLNECFY
jgi:alkylhydroperoxidase family enzyme